MFKAGFGRIYPPLCLYAKAWNCNILTSSHNRGKGNWTSITLGTLIVLALFGLWLAPYLVKEIRDGKRELGPLRRLWPGGRVIMSAPSPTGAGDNKPGRVGDPAPGQPDAQANPYGARAQREGPPVHS